MKRFAFDQLRHVSCEALLAGHDASTRQTPADGGLPAVPASRERARVPRGMPVEFVDDSHRDMQTIQRIYRNWREHGLKKEDARFVLPDACVSAIIASADFREWCRILQLRLSAKARWEIHRVCVLMLAIFRQHASACFDDIATDRIPSKLRTRSSVSPQDDRVSVARQSFTACRISASGDWPWTMRGFSGDGGR